MYSDWYPNRRCNNGHQQIGPTWNFVEVLESDAGMFACVCDFVYNIASLTCTFSFSASTHGIFGVSKTSYAAVDNTTVKLLQVRVSAKFVIKMKSEVKHTLCLKTGKASSIYY